MGFIDWKVKKTFEKIFKGIAKDLECNPSDVKIGIVYKDGVCVYEAYKGNEKVKDVQLSDYLNMFDSGTHVIDATIGQAGNRYASELSKKLNKEITSNEVEILLKENPGAIPHAVLMCGGAKQRMIDIKTEFAGESI